MNKKAAIGKNIVENLIFITISLIVFAIVVAFISLQMGGAGVWAEYYAKTTSNLINLASPGDEISLDIHKATEIARDNDLENFEEIFQINNKENELCVQLTLTRKTCYTYYNNVDIINLETTLGSERNILKFKLEKKQQDESI